MGLVERTVGGAYNQYAWMEERPLFRGALGEPTLEDTGTRYVDERGVEGVAWVTLTAERGETITVSEAEAARGDKLQAFVETLGAADGDRPAEAPKRRGRKPASAQDATN